MSVFVRYLSDLCPVFVRDFVGILPIFVGSPVPEFHRKTPGMPDKTENTFYPSMIAPE